MISCSEPRRRLEVGVGARLLGALLLVVAMLGGLTACGGGNSSSTRLIGGNVVAQAVLDQPTGGNTVALVVDGGPAQGFGSSSVNAMYATVTICESGGAHCVDVDHVLVDTGSIGLRVLQSAVASLQLPPLQSSGQDVVECYQFVLGGLWGGLASADVHIGSEQATAVPVQIIDDRSPMRYSAPADCLASSSPGLMNSVGALQAKGILGIGMLPYDCGLTCTTLSNSGVGQLYYACTATANASPSCAPVAWPASQQAANPIAHFALDNNGSIIAMPALPNLGAQFVRGRLIFGIGTQANNQLGAQSKQYWVGANPADLSTYLNLQVSLGGQGYPQSYIDSGSNAWFFSSSLLTGGCNVSAGSATGWYCPASAWQHEVLLSDHPPTALATTQSSISVNVFSADALFSTNSLAFSDLAGDNAQAPSSFVFGVPFFYGRSVATAIWGQTLAAQGPWNAVL